MFFSLWICTQIILICYPHGGDAIHYGEKAKFDRFKYMVCLFAYSENRYTVCGGVIIDEFYILTAAHCVSDLAPENIIVIADTPRINDPSGQFRGVKDIHLHPNFKANKNIPRTIYRIKKFLSFITKNPDARLVPKHDIAVLKLLQALPLGERMTKVELPKSDALPYCHELEYAGWGCTEDKMLPNYLQSTNMIILSAEECLSYDVVHRKTQFCAITANRTSLISYGDSGSPLVDKNILYGITSFIQGDSASMLVGFTKVSEYIHFIDDIINAANPTSDESDL